MIDALLVSFVVIGLAELGDKSQLLTLAFATRYPARVVLAGVAIAAFVMQAAAVAVGAAFAMALPTQALQIAAGLAFLAFAAWSLRDAGDEKVGDGQAARGGWWGVATVAAAFVVAEFADKTMLVAITLAATQDALGTWLGASAAMVAVNVVAIAVGSVLGSRLPTRAIRFLSAGAFAVFGLLLIASGLGLL